MLLLKSTSFFLSSTFLYTHKKNIIYCSETRYIDFQNQFKGKKSKKIKENKN